VDSHTTIKKKIKPIGARNHNGDNLLTGKQRPTSGCEAHIYYCTEESFNQTVKVYMVLVLANGHLVTLEDYKKMIAERQ